MCSASTLSEASDLYFESSAFSTPRTELLGSAHRPLKQFVIVWIVHINGDLALVASSAARGLKPAELTVEDQGAHERRVPDIPRPQLCVEIV